MTNDIDKKVARELARREIEHNRKQIADIERQIRTLHARKERLERDIKRLESDQ